MMMPCKRLFQLFVALAVMASFSACEDDDDYLSGGAGPDDPSVAGEWSGNLNGVISLSITLNQEEEALTGSYSDSSGYRGSVSGTVDGRDLVLTLVCTVPADTIVEFTGQFNESYDRVSGNYRVISGLGLDGTWSAAL